MSDAKAAATRNGAGDGIESRSLSFVISSASGQRGRDQQDVRAEAETSFMPGRTLLRRPVRKLLTFP